MIVKNEEKLLEESITSIKDFVDEIVIVDTGSTDKTKEIANKFTDKVVDFAWVGSFATARNFADSQASGDYVLTWDADYILDASSKDALKKITQNLTGLDIVYAQLLNDFDRTTKEVLQAEPRYLMYRKAVFEWKFPVHNSLEYKLAGVPKSVYTKEIKIWHYKQPHSPRYAQTISMLEDNLKTLEKGSKPYLRLQFFYGQDLKHAGRLDAATQAMEDYLEYSTNTEQKAFTASQLILTHLEQKNLKEAQIIAKTFQKNLWKYPIFRLAWADAMVFVEPETAAHVYEWFVDNAPYESPQAGSNPTRFVDHPAKMLRLLGL